MASVGTAHSVRPPGASDTSVSSIRVRLLSNSSHLVVVQSRQMEAEVKPSTGCDIFQWLREVCSTKLIATVFCFHPSSIIISSRIISVTPTFYYLLQLCSSISKFTSTLNFYYLLQLCSSNPVRVSSASSIISLGPRLPLFLFFIIIDQ